MLEIKNRVVCENEQLKQSEEYDHWRIKIKKTEQQTYQMVFIHIFSTNQTFSSVQFSRISITGAQTAEFPSKVCIHGGTQFDHSTEIYLAHSALCIHNFCFHENEGPTEPNTSLDARDTSEQNRYNPCLHEAHSQSYSRKPAPKQNQDGFSSGHIIQGEQSAF